MAVDFDVIVVGGGPGGSTTAALVAMQGHRVLLLERESFPRYQIGESLLPATTQWICGLLGVGEQLKSAGFQRKSGGTFLWGVNPEPWSFTFSTETYGERFAYQVERMKFDQILLDNARRVGVDVREQCEVAELILDDERVSGVRYTDAAGPEHHVTARFVVDASGNNSGVSRGLCGKREYSEYFRNIALFGYFEGGKRLPEPRSGNILCAAFGNGWFWYIPLSETLTSVGVVVPADMADKIRGDREHVLSSLIGECPIIQDHLAEAHRVTEGPYGEIRTRKDWSYASSQFWRPGLALVGDAACFVDPLFSTGVYLATYSGLLAARSINSVLAGAVEEATAFAESEFRHRREYELYHEFLKVIYNSHVDETSYFWSAKKLVDHPATGEEAFSDLTAGLGMGEFARPPERLAGARRQIWTNEPDEDASMRRFWRARAKGRVSGADQQRLLESIQTGWRARPERLSVAPDGVHWQAGDAG